DGLAIADRLARVCRSVATDGELAEVADLLGTVADGARCFLATQQQQVVQSMLVCFPDHFRRHVDGRAESVEPVPIAPIVDLAGGRAVLDANHARKQPDWT